LIAEGFSNKQIAGELVISIKTVEKQRQQVMNKLNIHDVAGLMRYAISKGIVERNVPVTVSSGFGIRAFSLESRLQAERASSLAGFGPIR
jgi:hypothetical protein